jgi:hypothetical protein
MGMHLLLTFALLVFTAGGLVAADATGKWTGTLTPTTGDGAGEARPAYLVLKQEGDKLTGTAGPGAGQQHTIENGKVENGNLTFEIPQESSIMKFALKLEGDEINGEVRREREGETEKAKLAVKREK